MNKFMCITFMIHVIYTASVVGQFYRLLTRRQGDLKYNLIPQRRYQFYLDQHDADEIIGAPSLPSHLPEAEPILPGHTLIRPAFGMLKSAVKFPHRELENGAGVLGNYNNLGIKYDGKNERVLYSGFRRNAENFSPSLNTRRMSSYLAEPSLENKHDYSEYIMVVPSTKKAKTSFTLSNLLLDVNDQKQMNEKVLERLKSLRKPVKKRKRLIMYVADPTDSVFHLTDLYEDKSPDENKFLQVKTAPTYYYLDSVEQEGVGSLPNARREENVELHESDDNNEEILSAEKGEWLETTKDDKNKDKTKREKFYATKNMFDNIKIHQDMLNYEDLIPEIKSNEDTPRGKKRPWWFFSEADFEPFHHYEE